MKTNQGTRSSQEVFKSHLYFGKYGTVEEDLEKNYSSDLVVLTGWGVFHGYDGMRQLAKLLREQLPDATFEYHTTLVEGEYAFLEWTGTSKKAIVRDGADSFVIRDGRIIAQTIHYTVEPLGEESVQPGSESKDS